MWAYLLCQPIPFLLGHPHQLLSEGVNFSLSRGFLGVDSGFVVVGLFLEVDEVSSGSPLSVRAVPRVVPYLPTFEAGIVSGAGCGLGDTTSCASSLSSPLVWGPRATEIHGNGSVIECWRSGG